MTAVYLRDIQTLLAQMTHPMKAHQRKQIAVRSVDTQHQPMDGVAAQIVSYALINA